MSLNEDDFVDQNITMSTHDYLLDNVSEYREIYTSQMGGGVDNGR